MEKSLVDSKPNDPNAEPCENYENLPFHGLQNPPTKVSHTTCDNKTHSFLLATFSLIFHKTHRNKEERMYIFYFLFYIIHLYFIYT
jgi:hypothetical protein